MTSRSWRRATLCWLTWQSTAPLVAAAHHMANQVCARHGVVGVKRTTGAWRSAAALPVEPPWRVCCHWQ